MVETRCPNPRCQAVFAIESRQLGRNVRCAACGQILTARPLAIWAALDRREEQMRAGALGEASFEEPKGFRAREQFRRAMLYHPEGMETSADLSGAAGAEAGAGGGQNGADAVPAALAHDPLYEPSSDRSDGLLLPTADLTVVIDDLRSQWNVGSIFRTAEGAGWAGLSLCGITPTPPAKGLVKTALGAEQHLPWSYHTHVLAALERCRAEGRELVALEQTQDAVPLAGFVPAERMALVLGNEVVGVSAEALGMCSRRVAIPMAGKKASLNVAVAFGVAAFAMAGAWRARMGSNGRMGG